jgi:HEPN domain-containing protein
MAKIKYYYDTKTLSYKRIQLSKLEKTKRYLLLFSSSLFLSLAILLVFFQFFDSPKENKLKNEIKNLSTQYKVIDENMRQIEIVLDDIQQRDDDIYRTIFEADPIPKSIRKQGFGGVNR